MCVTTTTTGNSISTRADTEQINVRPEKIYRLELWRRVHAIDCSVTVVAQYRSGARGMVYAATPTFCESGCRALRTACAESDTRCYSSPNGGARGRRMPGWAARRNVTRVGRLRRPHVRARSETMSSRRQRLAQDVRVLRTRTFFAVITALNRRPGPGWPRLENHARKTTRRDDGGGGALNFEETTNRFFIKNDFEQRSTLMCLHIPFTCYLTVFSFIVSRFYFIKALWRFFFTKRLKTCFSICFSNFMIGWVDYFSWTFQVENTCKNSRLRKIA